MATVSLPHADRLRRLQVEISVGGVDLAVLTPGPDLAYLLGHSVHSHERLSVLILPAAGEAVLLVPELERLGWRGSPAESTVRILTWTDGQDPHAMVAELVSIEVRLVAVGDHMPAAHALRIRSAFAGVELSLAGTAIAELRMRKTDDEIEALAAAGAAIDRVQNRIGEWLRAGRTENAVAADIAAAMVAEGHERPDFVIVGSGPNGASPHHEASERVIAPGDVVVIDIGGPTREGYFSDCTRTYQVAGTPDPEFERVYDIVQRAQQAGVSAVRPGATAESIDRASRAVIEESGYGQYFITRTGHGIGLEVHEEPYLVAGNRRLLEPGMTFSVEPGIYLPGRFGVRIEDIVAVTESSGIRLNHCSRELIVVG